MKVNQIIVEGRDAPLYHYAQVDKMKTLIKENIIVGDWTHKLEKFIGKKISTVLVLHETGI